MSLTFGSLFTGIGMIDLGLIKAGMECRWQIENDPACIAVLDKNFPGVKRYGDIRTVGTEKLERVDIVAGGFPCQDVSEAGRKVGLSGERSGLWREFRRIICHLRPRFVIVENVPGLLKRGMGDVLADLSQVGYDAEWETIPASAFGAPQRRERVFILAYPNGIRLEASRILDRAAIPSRQAQYREGPWGNWRTALSNRGGVFKVPDNGLLSLVDGYPSGVDNNQWRMIGNSVVWPIVEWIGKRVVEISHDADNKPYRNHDAAVRTRQPDSPTHHSPIPKSGKNAIAQSARKTRKGLDHA